MNWSYLLTSFEGRISRQPFWIALLTVFAVEIVVHLLALRIEGERLSAIVDLAFAYPEFAIFAKRGFDRNIPAWLPGAFFALGIFMDFLVITGWAGSKDDPSALVSILAVGWIVFLLALLLDFGFRRGTRGPNRYGSDPLAKSKSVST